jgi:hypothetical protein
MRRMRRFTYVVAPNGGVLHLAFGKLLEGEKLACGRRMAPKWKYGLRYKIDPSHHLPLCSKCQES